MSETTATIISGAVPIIPTPFDAHDEIDEDALRGMVEYCATWGFKAICLPAYGGEFYKLSDQERLRVVRVAFQQAAGRLPVIAQSNHGSAHVALATARSHIENGASLISIAVPRVFALSEDDLLRYLTSVFNGVQVPCLVQDFYPGGVISANFVARLVAECPNFRYIKFEEPMLSPKLNAIQKATAGRIGILDGTGGLYLMELIPDGLCGVMPSLALADAVDLVFKLRAASKSAEAFQLYEKLLPRLVFGLQNIELWLYCEKRLLAARGLLPNARCRDATLAPDPSTVRYVDELNARLLKALEAVGSPADLKDQRDSSLRSGMTIA
ncbi:MAG TPA: dihydrodipicolinate synthase family protein [Terriglobia bacterium]|nr:dihydrodipicolinate synthase family protein [Terriglobia bacterium]